MIYLGADHRGYKLKEQVKTYLTERGYQVTDLGTNSEEPVDYPIIAEKVVREVVKDKENRGIVICGTGGGVCVSANKIRGARAAEAWDDQSARANREHDDINVLCLAADRFSFDEVKPMIEEFLNARFDAAERRVRRLKQIEDIENNN